MITICIYLDNNPDSNYSGGHKWRVFVKLNVLREITALGIKYQELKQSGPKSSQKKNKTGNNFYMFRPMYSKQVFDIWTLFGFISVFLLGALLKFEIIVSFLWLSLAVHSGSLKRI